MGRLNRWQAEQLKAGRTKFKLGPYQVIDSIGQGGMGQVFKAEHTMMGRVVAIKVLPRHKSTPEAIASFTREIRAQAQLDHDNLVRAFDAGHDGNVYFLVTEYVPGTDLRKFVRARGKLIDAGSGHDHLAGRRGLEHAHSRGLIHRDVKPGNLLVTPDGTPKSPTWGWPAFWASKSERRPAGRQDRGHGRLSVARANPDAAQRHAGQRHLFARLHAVLRRDGQGAVPRRHEPRQGPPAHAKKRRSTPSDSIPT